jgi:hypothetical protein
LLPLRPHDHLQNVWTRQACISSLRRTTMIANTGVNTNSHNHAPCARPSAVCRPHPHT